MQPPSVRDSLVHPGPRLGFGCAHLYGGRFADLSLGVISAAIDLGVRYFDTARLYGHGEAEGLLGLALRGRRDRMFIASKAGVLPTPNGLGVRLRDRAQRAVRRHPALENVIPPPPVREPIFHAFAPATVRRSVEQSLRELRTDYLDLLLLHECTAAEVAHPGLLVLLEKLHEEGKIRGWGAAASDEETPAIAARCADRLSALQFAHSPFAPTLPHIRMLTNRPAIVHSVLSRRLHDFCAALRAPGDLSRRGRALGLDGADPSTVAPHLIASALWDNPDGVVLFSTLRFDHLRESLRALDIGREAAAAVAALAGEWASAAPAPPAALEVAALSA